MTYAGARLTGGVRALAMGAKEKEEGEGVGCGVAEGVVNCAVRDSEARATKRAGGGRTRENGEKLV